MGCSENVLSGCSALILRDNYFIKEGKVSEAGTHDQLIAQRGDYFDYVQQQGLNRRE